MKRRKIVQEVLEELDARPCDGEARTTEEWNKCILDHIKRGWIGKDGSPRDQFISIAATALAAVESIDDDDQN